MPPSRPTRPDRRYDRHPELPQLPDLGLLADERALRIAIVTEYYYPHLGGVCEHVHFFAREARRRGHQVDIITSHIPGALPQPHVIRLGRSQPIYCNGSQARITVGFGLRAEMRRILREGAYDIVHAHSPLTPTLPLLAIEEAPCPVVGTFHTYFDRSLAYGIGRRFFQRRLDQLAAAIAVSPSTTVALDRYFTADWHIVPNGIDTDVFRPEAPAPASIDPDRPTVLFLGRFDPRNGLTTLIDAFPAVQRRVPDAQVVVVGDGPLRAHYRAQARGQQDIHFVGSVLHGRPEYYANSTVYACPTTKASFGITLLESMACATPIVCSDILGFRDVVQHDREALMVPCGDPLALALSIADVLEQPALAERLGAAGLAGAQAYSWEHVTTQVLDVYRNVLGHTPLTPVLAVAR